MWLKIAKALLRGAVWAAGNLDVIEKLIGAIKGKPDPEPKPDEPKKIPIIL